MTSNNQKMINLERELYVHYHKQNYLDYKNANAPLEINWSAISEIYKQDAATLKKKMSALEQITNEGGQNIIDALGILNDISGNSSVYSEMEKKIAVETADKIALGLQKSIITAKALKNTKSRKEEYAVLEEYVNYIEDVINTYEKNNQDFMDYILKKYDGDEQTKSKINSLYLKGNQLSLIAINKSALTSFQTLQDRLKQLKRVEKSLKSGRKPATITYNKRNYNYQSLIYPMHYLFSNILGGLGEGIGAIFAAKSLDDFLKTLEDDTLKVEIEGTGNEKMSGGSVRKSDYTIQINDQTGEIDLSFGISAKAQNLKRGKQVTTTFESTNLKRLFEKYIIASNIEKYIFYNNLYHSINNTENQFLRRKFAAQSMLNAVTGAAQGENVLFLQYLDTLIRVDEFFESFVTAPSSKLPSLALSGVKGIKSPTNFIESSSKKINTLLRSDNYIDPTPAEKNLLAWTRSRRIIKDLNALTTQVQLTYK